MKYGTIVADPPWEYRKSANTTPADLKSRMTAEDYYPTMKMHEIAALPIADLAADNALLYLWVTNTRLYHDRNDHSGTTPYDILTAWGFRFTTVLTWVKQGSPGMGHYFRGDTEHVLLGVRGDVRIPPEKRESNVIQAARGRHSQKPDAFLDLVERVSPGPYLELFARRQRLGWETWGDQALKHVEVPA